MKKFSEQINERLKINKDTKISKLSFKINLNELKENDELYVVNIGCLDRDIVDHSTLLEPKNYGEALEVCKIVCIKKLQEFSLYKETYYELKTKYIDRPYNGMTQYLIFTQQIIDNYNNSNSKFLIANICNCVVFSILFTTKNKAQNFIDNYNLYKAEVLNLYETLTNTEICSRHSINGHD